MRLAHAAHVANLKKLISAAEAACLDFKADLFSHSQVYLAPL